MKKCKRSDNRAKSKVVCMNEREAKKKTLKETIKEERGIFNEV